MTDSEKLRRAFEEDTFTGNMHGLLRDECLRLRKENAELRAAFGPQDIPDGVRTVVVRVLFIESIFDRLFPRESQ